METIYSIIKESKTVYKTDIEVKRYDIKRSQDVKPIFEQLIGDDMEFREVFWIMLLNNRNQVISVQQLSTGSQTATVIDVKLILKTACDLMAMGVIMCHNHPSGNTTLSSADEALTQKVKKALELVDVKLLDHLIITPTSYYSFTDNGHI